MGSDAAKDQEKIRTPIAATIRSKTTPTPLTNADPNEVTDDPTEVNNGSSSSNGSSGSSLIFSGLHISSSFETRDRIITPFQPNAVTIFLEFVRTGITPVLGMGAYRARRALHRMTKSESDLFAFAGQVFFVDGTF